MNVYEIETLVRAADQLRNYERNSKGDNVHEKILDLVAAELGKVETAEELRSLQVSNDIKQANLNLIADAAIEVVEWLEAGGVSFQAREKLKSLAVGLRQEEPAAASC